MRKAYVSALWIRKTGTETRKYAESTEKERPE
jgi:hypothetical protein